MATDTATGISHGCEEVLVDVHAYIGDTTNATTAADFTREGYLILATFLRRSPPHRSRLYIQSPDPDFSSFSELPRIVCMVEGLILIRIAISCLLPNCILMEECDYFIYRVNGPQLCLLPHPAPDCFADDEVGLLPRGNDYTVAALLATEDPSVFTLRLFESDVGEWTSIKLTLQGLPREFPIETPNKVPRFFNHCTSTVITLGGEHGTMGWVDLWSGILLCDVCDPHPVLRHVPVPLPIERLKFDDGNGYEMGCPKPYRGIAFSKEKGCLRLVDLYVTGRPILEKSGDLSFRTDNWKITAWSNVKLTDSFDDWLEDFRPLDANKIDFSEPMRRLLLGYGLLQSGPSPQDKRVATSPGRNLENLWVYRPTPSMTDRNVVYLMAMAKFNHSTACVLAIDMEKKQLQLVADFGTKRKLGGDLIFSHGSFSKSCKNPPISLPIGNIYIIQHYIPISLVS